MMEKDGKTCSTAEKYYFRTPFAGQNTQHTHTSSQPFDQIKFEEFFIKKNKCLKGICCGGVRSQFDIFSLTDDTLKLFQLEEEVSLLLFYFIKIRTIENSRFR